MEKDFEKVIRNRKSTRSFSSERPPEEYITKVLESAIYAPFGGATGIPLNQIRRLYIFRQDTENMIQVSELMHTRIKKNAKKLRIMLILLPFLKKKFKLFSNKLNGMSKSGIPSLREAPYFIVIAEKKGFPPVEKQSMAHALENMWLTANSLGLGFQLISATGNMSKDKDFMELLGLKKGEYETEGCAVGYPKNITERKRELNIDNFVTWIK